MNLYGAIIFIAIITDYVLHTAADLLNLRALSTPVPEETGELYGAEGLARTKMYTRAATSESVAQRSISIAAVLLFWLLGGLAGLDGLVRGWFASELAQGLAFVGAVVLLYEALTVGFDAYRTFGLETRFGFNRTTWRTFVVDRAKGLLLTLILGGLLLAGLIELYLHAGAAAWVWCWIGVTAFSVVIQWLGPALILPLFNRFETMPEGELRDEVLRYAESVRYPLEKVYVIDGSRRSTRANAYLTGLGRRRRIALFDTLIEAHSISEIIAVLAHEIGHHRLHHVIKGLVLGGLQAGLSLFILNVVLGQPGLYHAMLLPSPSLHAGLVGFALFYIPASGLLAVLMNGMTRRFEYAADRFAVDTAPAPQSLVDALKKLAVVNLTHPRPHRLYVWLNYTHPPLAERLSAIERRIGTAADSR